MRRWMAAPLVFAAAAALCISTAPPRAVALAQAKAAPPIEETFVTPDGVQLRGLFHKSATDPGTSPVVILMYPPGKGNDMTKGDWDGLANFLSEKGFNVFRFDWRGHGKSTDIKDTDKFWGIPTATNPNPNPFTAAWNLRYIAGGPPKKPIKDTINFKDFNNPVKYAPMFLTDMAAVRFHLDSKNDAGDLNTSSIYLIGAESAATIGLGFMTCEWKRPAFAPKPNELGAYPRYEYVPQPLRIPPDPSGGTDISGAIWLSAHRPASVPERTIEYWVAKEAPKMRDNNPMLFMYAENDKIGKEHSEFFHLQALVGKGDPRNGLNKLNDAYLKKVEGADKLSGVALLGNNDKLKTEDTILKFLEAIQKERAKITRKPRNFTSPYFIDLRYLMFSP